MGSFIQIIEYSSSNIDEISKLAEDFREKRSAEGPGGPTMGLITASKDQPGRYMTIVEFPSYEAAMENSNHTLTQEFSQRMSELCDGPPTFYNLDLIDRW